jgi:prepilin-type N-terminal cleavage/methylation domain-containing protein
MKQASNARSRAGFTLIEILVTLILLSLLVAAVFPVVTQQLGQADAPRLGNDLVSVRSGIEAFNANLRKGFPGDLEDLIYSPVTSGTTGDADVDGNDYISQTSQRWNGPYADFTATEATSEQSGNLFESGFSAFVDYDLECFNPASGSAGDAGDACANGYFVAVQINSLTLTDFEKVNELFDGSTESTSSTVAQTSGKLRCVVSGTVCGPAYYLAVPFRN